MEDMDPWTGCAVFQEGVFHLFYTMRSTRDALRSNFAFAARPLRDDALP